MRNHFATLENTVYSSVWLVYANSFVMVTTYFMDQTSTTHSVDTGIIYAVFKLSFSKQYEI